MVALFSFTITQRGTLKYSPDLIGQESEPERWCPLELRVPATSRATPAATAPGWGRGQPPHRGRTTAPAPTFELEIIRMHQRDTRTGIAESLFPASLTHYPLSINFLESCKYYSTAHLVPLFMPFVSISITNFFKGFITQPQKATSDRKLAYSFPVWEQTTLSN